LSKALIAAFWLSVLPLFASAQPVQPPRLIVAISVDQFSADLFAEYRPLFSSGMKLLSAGAVFPSAYQSHAATETCPGHSTILTGSHPARTGIIANEWIDQSVVRPDKLVYCSEDPTVPGSTSTNYSVSPQFLKVPTLGDRMKAFNPQSRVVSVAGKDRAAVMMGGHAIDQIWYWGGKSYVTLPGRTGPAPAIVSKVNQEAATDIAHPAAQILPKLCRERAVPVSVGSSAVGTLPTRKADDFKAFRASVSFDRATTDIAIGLIRALKLGQGDAPDVISIGLSATDYVGHGFGVEGAEMCAQMVNLDENVGRILVALDQFKLPYVVVLTADHGGHDVPERNSQRGFPDAVRVDPALTSEAIGKILAEQFHLSGPVLVGGSPAGDIYLDRQVPADLRPLVLAAARARFLSHPQVAAVFTAAELRRMPSPTGPVDEWSLAERFRASYDPERSGDLLVALKPHVTPIADAKSTYVATHGSPWNYDRRVPLIFYRPGAIGFEQPLPVETVDILPTLAGLIALPIEKSEIDGRCLDLDPGTANSCREAP
jgi:alkaline phosphatase